VTFQQIGNAALLTGYFASIDPGAPTWTTPAGTIGTFNRNTAVSLPLKAQGDTANGRAIASYTVVTIGGTVLPAGLVLTNNVSAQTATITGNVDLYPVHFSEPEFPLSPSPVWNTPAGVLPNAVLSTAYTVNLSATPMLGNAIARFSLLSGNLPFGVAITTNSVTNSGALAGTLDPSAALTDPVASLPAPVWNTDSGLLASAFNGISGNTVNVTVSATPTYGNAIVNYAIFGQGNALPDGLIMSPKGVISGNVAPSAALIDGQYLLPGPTWNTANGSLGSANNGSAVTLNLSFTPVANTTANLSVVSGGLPAGTLLRTTNASIGTATISGTLDANTSNTSTTLDVARTFAFTLRAIGSDGGYSDLDFTFTANVT
jgi:hypothetical protein